MPVTNSVTDYRCKGVIPAEMFGYNSFPSRVAVAEEAIEMFAFKKNAVIKAC